MHEILTCVNFHTPLTYLFIRLKVTPSQHALYVEQMGYDHEHSSLASLIVHGADVCYGYNDNFVRKEHS